MLTMGSDFQYENANLWYKNLEKLIHYVNKVYSQLYAQISNRIINKSYLFYRMVLLMCFTLHHHDTLMLFTKPI